MMNTVNEQFQLPQPDPEDFEKNFINGEWTFTREGFDFDIFDPTDSSVVAAVPLSTHRDADRALTSATAAGAQWRAYTLAARRVVLLRALAWMRENCDALAVLSSRDMGVPFSPSRAMYLDMLDRMSSHLHQEAEPNAALSSGPSVALLCWDLPLITCVRVSIACLLAGGTMVVKPSLRAPLTPVCWAKALEYAELPAGAFNLVQGTGMDVGAALARHPAVKHIVVQGKPATIAAVKRSATNNGADVDISHCRWRHWTISIHSDLASAISDIYTALQLHNLAPQTSGLSCTLDAAVLESVVAELAAKFLHTNYGKASGGSNTIAPHITERRRLDAEAHFAELIDSGVEVLYQGTSPSEASARMGWYAPPRILLNVGRRQIPKDAAGLGPAILFAPQNTH